MSERLEEIKEIFGVHKMQTFADRKTIPFNLDDIEWLIEQVERVQELEKERDEWKDTAQSYYMTNQELREQNKHYRKVLAFYANKDNYKDMPLFDDDKCRVCGCSWDNACVTDDGPCYWVEEDLCSSCAKGE